MPKMIWIRLELLKQQNYAQIISIRWEYLKRCNYAQNDMN